MVIIRRVERVIDGDTFIVSKKIGNTNRIRLAVANVPENYQSESRTATNRLRDLIGGKTVTIIPVGKSYGRTVANVKCQRKIVNKIRK